MLSAQKQKGEMGKMTKPRWSNEDRLYEGTVCKRDALFGGHKSQSILDCWGAATLGRAMGNESFGLQ